MGPIVLVRIPHIEVRSETPIDLGDRIQECRLSDTLPPDSDDHPRCGCLGGYVIGRRLRRVGVDLAHRLFLLGSMPPAVPIGQSLAELVELGPGFGGEVFDRQPLCGGGRWCALL